jgi:hypothetical protein
MIDKIRTTNVPLTRLVKKPKVKSTDNKTKLDKEIQNNSLIDKIKENLEIYGSDSNEQIKSKIILEVLTQALGDKASNEPAFRALISKIENILKNDTQTDDLIDQIKHSSRSQK